MNFESHVMPRLAKEYKDAGKKKVPFDLEKVRALGRDSKSKDKEFNAQAWDQIDFLESNLAQNPLDSLNEIHSLHYQSERS